MNVLVHIFESSKAQYLTFYVYFPSSNNTYTKADPTYLFLLKWDDVRLTTVLAHYSYWDQCDLSFSFTAFDSGSP